MKKCKKKINFLYWAKKFDSSACLTRRETARHD